MPGTVPALRQPLHPPSPDLCQRRLSQAPAVPRAAPGGDNTCHCGDTWVPIPALSPFSPPATTFLPPSVPQFPQQAGAATPLVAQGRGAAMRGGCRPHATPTGPRRGEAMQGSTTTSPPRTPRPSRTQHLSGTHVPPLPHGSPPGTDPPARHAQGDVLLGGPPVAPTARPRGSQPGAVREAVGQGGEHLLLLLGAAQALVVASLAHGWGRGGGSERGALRRRPRLPGGGEGWSRAWDHMAESCCSSGKQREGEGDRGDGGEGGRADGCRGEGEKKK